MAASLELVLEARRPVAAAHLVAVDERACQASAYERAQSVDDGLDAAGPECIQCLAAHLVTLQTVAAGQSRMISHARGREAKAQDGPSALGGLPCQCAARLHLVREVHDVCLMHHGTVRHLAQRRHQMALEGVVGQRLDIQASDALCHHRCGEGQHGDVLIASMIGLRFGHHQANGASALHLLLAPCHCLHSIFGLHPRSAARRPSRTIVERQLHAQPLGLAGCVLEQLEPLVAHVFHGSLREAHSTVEQRGLVNAHTMHGLQVGRDTFAGHVAVQPVPPRADLCLPRRIVKAFPQFCKRGVVSCLLRLRAAGVQRRNRCQQRQCRQAMPGTA